MNHQSNKQPGASIQVVQEVAKNVFTRDPERIERVYEGVSTFVYRVVFPGETFYLRVLPEEDASFAQEAAVHTRLRQMHINVPEIISFEDHNELLQRSVMITTEIKGLPLSQSGMLSQQACEEIMSEAGRDLARLNTVPVEGFGWIRRDSANGEHLRATWPAHRTFVLEHWEADLAYLAEHVLQPSEAVRVEQISARYDSWLESELSYLAHGDFDVTHIYQENGRYTGIIDFGEIRGASQWYDLGHFHMRDGEQLSLRLLPALLAGYQEARPLSPDYEQRIRFTALLINIRALARSLQKRPPDRYTRHQLEVLREDLAWLP